MSCKRRMRNRHASVGLCRMGDRTRPLRCRRSSAHLASHIVHSVSRMVSSRDSRQSQPGQRRPLVLASLSYPWHKDSCALRYQTLDQISHSLPFRYGLALLVRGPRARPFLLLLVQPWPPVLPFLWLPFPWPPSAPFRFSPFPWPCVLWLSSLSPRAPSPPSPVAASSPTFPFPLPRVLAVQPPASCALPPPVACADRPAASAPLLVFGSLLLPFASWQMRYCKT